MKPTKFDSPISFVKLWTAFLIPLSACSLKDINRMYPTLPSLLNLTALTVMIALLISTLIGSSSPIRTIVIIILEPTGPLSISTASCKDRPKTPVSSI